MKDLAKDIKAFGIIKLKEGHEAAQSIGRWFKRIEGRA